MKSNRPLDANGLQNDGTEGHDLSVFSYASIIAATCNFSKENKLGEGGFGPVYKVSLWLMPVNFVFLNFVFLCWRKATSVIYYMYLVLVRLWLDYVIHDFQGYPCNASI